MEIKLRGVLEGRTIRLAIKYYNLYSIMNSSNNSNNYTKRIMKGDLRWYKRIEEVLVVNKHWFNKQGRSIKANSRWWITFLRLVVTQLASIIIKRTYQLVEASKTEVQAILKTINLMLNLQHNPHWAWE